MTTMITNRRAGRRARARASAVPAPSADAHTTNETSATTTGLGAAAFLSPEAVSRLTGLSEQTLANLRCAKRGIPFHRFGRKVAYSRADVAAYIDSTKVATSGK